MSDLQKYSFKYTIKCDCQQSASCRRFHGCYSDLQSYLVDEEWQIDYLQNLRQQLNSCKKQIGQYASLDWNRHTDFTEISSGIKHRIIRRFRPNIPPILTRAWIKFYDILCTFNLINSDSNIRVLFLCEAPGAFVNATNHFIKSRVPELNFEWIANTLNPYYEQIDIRSCIWNDIFIREPNCFRNWFFAQSNKGDIFESTYMDSLANHLKNRFHSDQNMNDGTFDLATGDGAFDCFDRFDRQEESVFPLIKTEIKISLQHLRQGGNLVVKFFTFFDCQTISLLYLLSNCFGNVCCYKPVASKKGNSEIYVICQRFQRQIYLIQWANKLDNNINLIINRQSIPENFIDQIYNLTSNLTTRQIKSINRNIHLFETMTEKDENEVENLKYRLADKFINEFHLFPITESNQLAYPSAYSKQFHLPVFIKKLKEFHLFRSEIRPEDVRELCKIICKSKKIDDQPIEWHHVMKDSKFSYITFPPIEPIYGTPYTMLNNSRYVCIFLLKSFEPLRSFVHQESHYEIDININEILRKYGKYLKFSNSQLVIANFDEPSLSLQRKCEWHFIDLLPFTCSIDSNDYEMCHHLYDQFCRLNFSNGDSLIFRCRALFSRLSVSLVFILSRFFQSYLFYSTRYSEIYCILNEYNKCSVNKDSHIRVLLSNNIWNPNLLELISVPFIQSNPIFFKAINDVNNYNLFYKLKQISNDFITMENDSSSTT